MSIWNWDQAGILPAATMVDSRERNWYSWRYIESLRKVLEVRLRSSLKEFGEMLDKYIVLALTTSWEKLSQLNKLYRRIVNFVKDIKIKGKKDEIIYEKILEALSEWAESKNEQLYLGYKRIPVYQWLTLTALAGLLIMFLFIIRTNDIISIVTTVVFSFSIILSLTLIHDLDTYNFAYDSMEEPSQSMFDMMGKKRFYWEEDIKMGIVSPPKGTKYRTRVPREYLKELK